MPTLSVTKYSGVRYNERCILFSKCDGTRWRTGGEVKWKLANGVGSQYSHTISEGGVSSITKADAQTSAASSRLNWLPRPFKWTHPFRRKTKSGFCACDISFRTSSTTKDATMNECYNEWCYNERMLQRTDAIMNSFIYKIRMLTTKHRCYNERRGILSVDVARAFAWRVRPSRFD